MKILRAVKIDQTITIPHDQFAEWVDQHGNTVYKLCRSLAFSKEDTDDLFQETFLKAFEQSHKVNASDNPQGFFCSVTIYIWKSWKRKHARRERIAPVTPMDETIAESRDIEDDFVAQEQTRIVRRVVDTLPEKYKIPVILYYTMEMGMQEIASALGIPAGTVKSRLFKARKLVEKGLIASGYEK